MTGRHFIKIIIPALSMAYAGEGGCQVDLTAKAPCGQERESIKAQIYASATDEMQPLEETEFDSKGQTSLSLEEADDPVPPRPKKPHSMKNKKPDPAPVKSPGKSQVSPPAEDDREED